MPVWGNQTVVFDSTKFVTSHGDSISLSLLKFYVSDFSQAGQQRKNVHLFDSDQPETFTWTLNGTIQQEGISFKIGLDSAYNTSGALNGDLDPIKGMYWAWNSGYIMAKIEGISNASKALHHLVEYHIGGYKSPYNTVRNVELSLPSLKNGTANDIYINVDLSTWFVGVDISKLSSVVIPGEEAAHMADRYSKMCSVLKVE